MLKMMNTLHPESPADYVATAKSVEQVIDEVKPTLVAVDNLMEAARDALKAKKQASVMLSPNTLKDVASGDQGGGVFSWPW